MTDDTPAPAVWPTLRARDARALIRFLVEAFGFEETVVYGDYGSRDFVALDPEGNAWSFGTYRGAPRGR
jgi:uncharacterized glyoxalase superfamily protein PhnB